MSTIVGAILLLRFVRRVNVPLRTKIVLISPSLLLSADVCLSYMSESCLCDQSAWVFYHEGRIDREVHKLPVTLRGGAR